MVASDFSDKDIALALGISSRTVRRNKHCDPKRCCCLENVSTEIYNYKNRILELVSEGYHATVFFFLTTLYQITKKREVFELIERL